MVGWRETPFPQAPSRRGTASRKFEAPMSARPCPTCHAPAPRWLENSSAGADVDYFRCEICGHVWCLPKGEPNALPRTVTQGVVATPV